MKPKIIGDKLEAESNYKQNKQINSNTETKIETNTETKIDMTNK